MRRERNISRVLIFLVIVAVLISVFCLQAFAMQIFVRTTSGSVVTLEVERNEEIESIRARILEKLGLSPEEYHLIFNGNVLSDGNTLEDYSILKDSTLVIELHYYGDCTDTVCDAEGCGYTREANEAHSYTDCSDSICNNEGCDFTREASGAHIYTDCTDSICNNEGCTVTREASAAHSFSDCTDTACNNIGCPFTRVANSKHNLEGCTDTSCGNVGCGFTREAKEHVGGSATCTNRAVCDECGCEYGELAEHEEKADEWIVTDTHHYHRCKYWSEITSCKEKYEYSEHTYGEWTVTKEADVLIEGEQMRECICGAKDYESIPAKSIFENPITNVEIIVIVICVLAVIIICAVAWYIKQP